MALFGDLQPANFLAQPAEAGDATGRRESGSNALSLCTTAHPS
jgi:hypothetical protein